MASNNLAVNTADKKGIEAQASGVARKRCGRCRTAVEETEFCPACREFFRMLGGAKRHIHQRLHKTHRGV
jgi:hypothetical protein